jgi:hypothetical protein
METTIMITRELLQKIRSHKGPLYVEINNHDDNFWVQVVKSDLLFVLSRLDAESESGFVLDSRGYFSIDYATKGEG